MASNEQKLRRFISKEIKSVIKESVRPRRNRSLSSLIFEEDEKPADKEKSGDKPAEIGRAHV